MHKLAVSRELQFFLTGHAGKIPDTTLSSGGVKTRPGQGTYNNPVPKTITPI